MKQVEDVRNAISYLQGEPGVDPDRIGLWGSSFAGGNAIVVAALDARVKAIVSAGPRDLRARTLAERPYAVTGACSRTRSSARARGRARRSTRVLDEAHCRRGDESGGRGISAVSISEGGRDRAGLFIVAQNEELFSNEDNAYAAARC